jgi:Arc/MetJ-type ribon-helix-helix transcriptional regulator
MTTQLAVLVADGRLASRSDAVRHGISRVVGDAERERIDDAFAAGFARHPDDDALAEAERLATEAITEGPWERWW